MRDPAYPDADAPHRLDGKLEPEARDGVSSTIEAAALSAAISLKRIADALAGGDGALNAYFFEQAAYQAGIAFERGRR